MFQGWLGRFSVACWFSITDSNKSSFLALYYFPVQDIADVGSLVAVIITASPEHQGPTPEPEIE